MILYPKLYLDKVTDLTIEMIKSNQIKGIILDVDNTLLDFEKRILPNAELWCEALKKERHKTCHFI